MLSPPTLDLAEIRSCLRSEYRIEATGIEFLPIGDTHSAVYRVDRAGGEAYFVKLRSEAIYEAAGRAASYLFERGATEVVAPLATVDGALWTGLDRWNVLVFPFIAGDTGWETIGDEHWREAGRIFRRFHVVQAPDIAGLRRESFEPAPYSEAMESLRTQVVGAENAGPVKALRVAWDEHRASIESLLSTMQRLAVALRERAQPLVVCHADLHPGNLLRGGDGHVYVIDWDDVMLAPRERDFIFTGEPELSPFLEGYGDVEIDWEAVTYYRGERVVTDLIEYAKDMFRELDDETKLRSAAWFRTSLEGRNFAAAQRAASRIDLRLG